MVKTAFEEGFDSSRFIISTTTTKQGEEYLCKGRAVQGRGTLLEDGEIDWEDKSVTSEAVGDNPSVLDSLVLEKLFQYLSSHEFYLFEDKEEEKADGDKDDL